MPLEELVREDACCVALLEGGEHGGAVDVAGFVARASFEVMGEAAGCHVGRLAIRTLDFGAAMDARVTVLMIVSACQIGKGGRDELTCW